MENYDSLYTGKQIDDAVGAVYGFSKELEKKQNLLKVEQLDAVNSGITADKVTKYEGYETKINSTISELSYQLAMMKENLFQTVLSKIDYTEDFATLYPIPDTLSDTDGTHRVLFSETQLREVAGNSIAYNQGAILTRNNVTIRSITFVNNGDETLSINGTSEKEENFVVGTFKLVQGHKYLAKTRFISGSPTDTTYYIKWSTISYGVDVGNGLLFTATSLNDSAYILFTIYASNISIDCKISLNIFDLTISGIDSVTTADEARSELLKRGIDIDQYNPYSEGEIRNTTASGVKVNGYNLFDENIYNGYWNANTGIKIADSNFRASNGYIKVLPNASYLLELKGNGNDYRNILGYDENKNFISRFATPTNNSTIIRIPSNVHYITFYFNANIYEGDVCFHLTGTRTGYAPYKEPKAISFASTELLGAGEAHDTIEVVEGKKVAGIQRYNLVHVKRVGTVDLGTLNWAYSSKTNRFSVLLSDAKPSTNNETKGNIICSLYQSATYTETLSVDKTIAIDLSSYLYVRDTEYNDVATFKQAKTGVILNYELATPTRTVIAENLTFEEVSATIEQGGSIESVYETLASNISNRYTLKNSIGGTITDTYINSLF